ncbi:MAG: GNAT family N-acetyltransferase [Bacteroidetes bacterium]|nr:GNAT family N-acetyltransferase [Bacteroidota bacterium]
MKTPFLFRAASPNDAPIIHALAQHIWWAHYPGIVSNEQIAYMLERGYSVPALVQQMQEGQTFYLAFMPELKEPIGYVSISPKEPGAYFIHKFYIDPAQQGKGIGRQMFDALLEQYPDLQSVSLVVNRKNFKSINFYFKIGFVIHQCLDTDIGNGFFMIDYEMVWKRKSNQHV